MKKRNVILAMILMVVVFCFPAMAGTWTHTSSYGASVKFL